MVMVMGNWTKSTLFVLVLLAVFEPLVCLKLRQTNDDHEESVHLQIKELQQRHETMQQSHKSEVDDYKRIKVDLDSLKAELAQKDVDLTTRSESLEQLMTEVKLMKDETESYNQELKNKEEKLQLEKEQLDAEELALATSIARNLHQTVSEEELEEMVAPQENIEMSAGIVKSIDELPAEALSMIGPKNDTDAFEHIKAQGPVAYVPPEVTFQPNLSPSDLDIKIVDRSSRNIETRLDERPSTYGQKLLIGQAYSASFGSSIEHGDSVHDDDGLCRNSRAEVVPCQVYSVNNVPPIVPTIGELMSDDYRQLMQGEGLDLCVLKCSYHKGLTTTSGPKNIQEISIEIPIGSVKNTTYGCPKTNNGYPFLSCSLVSSGTNDKCQSTCVFDGNANPLKPRMMGIGVPTTGSGAFSFNLTDFRSFAHTTYTVTTATGCKSSMKADPLVACEVQL